MNSFRTKTTISNQNRNSKFPITVGLQLLKRNQK